ncbi:hypothetical protein, partial [Dorea sp. D27]|uniref:hypothetical protein n=1 Tax=Dorea sp. D27 TaxID=658665 RepID=UPI001A9A45AE
GLLFSVFVASYATPFAEYKTLIHTLKSYFAGGKRKPRLLLFCAVHLYNTGKLKHGGGEGP